MSLTQAQLTAIKAEIDADPALAGQPNNSDGYFEIARQLNLPASPAWTAWRSNVATLEIGKIMNYVAVAAMTTANLDRVRTFTTLNPESFDGGRADIRTYMDDTFSGALGGQGAATRAALLAMYKFLTTRVQRVLSTGTGSDATPATLASNITQDYRISVNEVEAARKS